MIADIKEADDSGLATNTGGFHRLAAVAHRDDAADSIPIVLHHL